LEEVKGVHVMEIPAFQILQAQVLRVLQDREKFFRYMVLRVLQDRENFFRYIVLRVLQDRENFFRYMVFRSSKTGCFSGT
jgi:hypothetical protein